MSHKVDAVLPIIARDLERFERLLAPTLLKYFTDLGTLWIVTPDIDVSIVSRTARAISTHFVVVAESELVPELAFYRHLPRRYIKERTKGWCVQQIVKLAIAQHVKSSFYLTLDADIICVKTVSYNQLIRDGRALVRVCRSSVHDDWYRDSALVLGFPRPTELTHGVTPALLSRDIVIALQSFLRERISLSCRAAEWMFTHAGCPKPAALCGSWRSFLIRNYPWTEYSLYHGFAAHQSLIGQYHELREDVLYGSSVWSTQDWESWNAEEVPDDVYFTVCQSTVNIPVDSILSKLEKVFPARRE